MTCTPNGFIWGKGVWEGDGLDKQNDQGGVTRKSFDGEALFSPFYL